jgi:calcium-dependent protein kinase
VTINRSDFINKNTGKFTDLYSVGKVLGVGAFGEVRLCMSKAGKIKRAVKLIKKDQMSPEDKLNLKNEMNILKKLDHPNILKLYEIFEDPKTFYLVTEYCKGGELFDEIIKKKIFSEADAAAII